MEDRRGTVTDVSQSTTFRLCSSAVEAEQCQGCVARVEGLLAAMGFPQELETVRFNSEPKRCKSVSLSPKRLVFTLVGLAHGVVTEKLRFP